MSYNDHEIETLKTVLYMWWEMSNTAGEMLFLWIDSYGGFGCGWEGGLLLGHTRAVDAGGAHLCEDLVQPLKGTVKM